MRFLQCRRLGLRRGDNDREIFVRLYTVNVTVTALKEPLGVVKVTVPL